jgi:hypothetical protein
MLLALIKSPSMVVPPFEGLLVIRHDCISHWRWRFGGTLCTGVAEFSTDVPPCAVKNSSAKRDARRHDMAADVSLVTNICRMSHHGFRICFQPKSKPFTEGCDAFLDMRFVNDVCIELIQSGPHLIVVGSINTLSHAFEKILSFP